MKFRFLILQDRKVNIRGGAISTIVLEKDKEWPMMNHEDDILMQSGLNDLTIVGHVQHDLQLITSLEEHWDQDTNTFHLPPGEMKVTLLDVYRIWGIPIHG